MKNVIKKPNNKQGNLFYSKKEMVTMSIANQILAIAVFLCVIVVLFNYYLSTAEIEGVSMLPTYNVSYNTTTKENQDIAYYTKYFSYDRGDVVIPDLIDENGERFLIKRLIAKGGDKVEFINGQLYVNEKIVNETYIVSNASNLNMIKTYMLRKDKSNDKTNIETWNHITLHSFELNHISFTVDENYVFYLGDNRGISYDCASYGPKPESIIKAKVVFVVPYNQTLVQYLWTSFLNLFK